MNNYLKVLKKAKNIAMFSHSSPDPDTIGSSIALYNALLKMGKNVDLYCEDNLPETYYFLDEANLQKIAVLDSYRRKGIATQLIENVEKELLANNIEIFYLEVNEHNLIAISVYEKLGFDKLSTRKNYYGNDSAIIFQKKIN